MAASSDPQKVKLLCSFGGKILPSPSDGALRYAGGHTRILSLRRSSTLSDLYAKISHISNAPIAAVKFQLPDEDLDALISISSQEDLDNMFEEFDRICEIAPDGSSRMRILLLSPSDLVDPNPNEAVDTGQSYIDAVNGIGIKRNNSLVSASSNEGISSPSLLSPTAAAVASMNHQDSGRVLGFFGDETTLVSGRMETQQVQFLNPSVNVVKFSPALPYVHPIYINAGNLKPNQGRVEPLMVGGDQLGNTGTGSNQGKVEGSVCLEENSSRGCRADQNCSNSGGGGNTYDKGFHHNHLQPLSQLPPLHPALVQNLPNSYVPPLRPIPQHTLRLEDCQLCQKSLPHAHSDMLINEHPSGNGNGSGSSVVLEQRAVLQSHHSEDPMRLQASLRVENPVEPRVENERIVHTNTEVEVKRTIPKGAAQAKDFETKEIFVGGIPTTVGDDEFKSFFSKFGKVVEHEIIRDHTTKRSQGFGFDAEEAVDDLSSKGNVIDFPGRQVYFGSTNIVARKMIKMKKHYVCAADTQLTLDAGARVEKTEKIFKLGDDIIVMFTGIQSFKDEYLESLRACVKARRHLFMLPMNLMAEITVEVMNKFRIMLQNKNKWLAEDWIWDDVDSQCFLTVFIVNRKCMTQDGVAYASFHVRKENNFLLPHMELEWMNGDLSTAGGGDAEVINSLGADDFNDVEALIHSVQVLMREYANADEHTGGYCMAYHGTHDRPWKLRQNKLPMKKSRIKRGASPSLEEEEKKRKLKETEASGLGAPNVILQAAVGDHNIQVCRYCQQQPEKSICSVCGTAENLWICVICGFVGCGRYKEGHAIRHWKETQHCYSLELETQRVWDYAGDNYVRRLIQSKTDGKLVELNFHCPHHAFGSCECGVDSAIDEALFSSKVDALHDLIVHIEAQKTIDEQLPDIKGGTASPGPAASSSSSRKSSSKHSAGATARSQKGG